MEKTKIFSFYLLLFLCCSITNAQDWEFVGLDSMVIKQLYVSGDTIWAGTAHRVGNQDRSGLYKSIDGGNTWTRLDDTLGIGNIYSFSIDKENTNNIWIIKGYNAYGTGIFYKSTDGGENWSYAQNVTQNIIQWFDISPFNKNEIYFIDESYAPGGILNTLHKSTDGGENWQTLGPFPSSSHGTALTFAFDLTDSMNLYVTVDTQFDRYLYKSNNKGENWSYISEPPISPSETKTDLFLSGRLYLYSYYKVTDNEGLTWYDAYNGLTNNIDYLSFYQNKETTKLLYVLRTDGLYSSKSDTVFWSLVAGSDELPIYFGPNGFYSDRDLHNIFIESERKELFLGTAKGIYKTTVITDVTETNIYDFNFYLSQNYPNPFNPSTKIKFSIPKNEFVNLIVYNLIGEKVVELVNEAKTAGEYEVSFNAANLPSGIYLAKMSAGEFNQAVKMLFLK